MTTTSASVHVATLREILVLARTLSTADEVPLRIAGERIADIIEAQQMLYDFPVAEPNSTPDEKGPGNDG